MALSTVFIKGKVALDAPDQLTGRIQRSLWNPGLITQRLIVEDTEAGQAARVYLFFLLGWYDRDTSRTQKHTAGLECRMLGYQIISHQIILCVLVNHDKC